MKTIVYFDNIRDTLVVQYPVWDEFPDITDAEMASKVVPDGVEYQVIESSELPNNRDFRNAWKIAGGTVDVDMEKATDIHWHKIREARNAKLKELDIETMKGKNVQVEKQILRDLPANIDLTASTPEELRAIWPDELL